MFFAVAVAVWVLGSGVGVEVEVLATGAGVEVEVLERVVEVKIFAALCGVWEDGRDVEGVALAAAFEVDSFPGFGGGLGA